MNGSESPTAPLAMETARKYAREVNGNFYFEVRDAFMAGVAWQAQQDRLAVQAAATGTAVDRRARDRDLGE